jgi:hypothetical protein
MAVNPKSSSGASSHDCGASLLKCIDCAACVCPQCMIACPVGNRCKSCAGKRPEGAVTSRPIGSREQSARLIGCAILLGIAMSWMDWYMGNFLQGVFWFVFLFAGLQAGQTCRRDKGETLPLLLIGTFLSCNLGSTVVFALAEHFPSLLGACIPVAFNAGAVAIGFGLGRFLNLGCGR